MNNKELREEIKSLKASCELYDKLAKWLMCKHNKVWREWIEEG